MSKTFKDSRKNGFKSKDWRNKKASDFGKKKKNKNKYWETDQENYQEYDKYSKNW